MRELFSPTTLINLMCEKSRDDGKFFYAVYRAIFISYFHVLSSLGSTKQTIFQCVLKSSGDLMHSYEIFFFLQHLFDLPSSRWLV